MKKTLCALVMAAAGTLALGCNSTDIYKFNGRIAGKNVKYDYHSIIGDNLTVTDNFGNGVEYKFSERGDCCTSVCEYKSNNEGRCYRSDNKEREQSSNLFERAKLKTEEIRKSILKQKSDDALKIIPLD